MKHKHCDLIKAWADGAEIQYFDKLKKTWLDKALPGWFSDIEYRLKQQAKPDIVLYCLVSDIETNNVGKFYAPVTDAMQRCAEHINFLSEHGFKLKLTFDGDARSLEKAEVI